MLKTIQTLSANEFSSYFNFKDKKGNSKSFHYIEIFPADPKDYIKLNGTVFAYFVIIDGIKYHLALEMRKGKLNAGLWNHSIKTVKMFESDTAPTQDEIEFVEDVLTT